MLARQIGKSDILFKKDNFASLEFFLKDEQNSSKYTYIGEVNSENEMDGYGKLWNDSYCYHGNFKNNTFDGNGILKYTGNTNDLSQNFVTFFKGNFMRNKKNGEGHEIYFSNEYYKGTFLNDLRHGKGTLFNANGEAKIESSWELGRSVNNSNITEYYSNGCLEYRGEYNGMHRHGKGVLCNKKGEIIFDGILEDGQKKEGKLFSNNFITFQGSFKQGLPYEGTFYHDNGVKLCNASVSWLGNSENNNLSFSLVGQTIVCDKTGNKIFDGELIPNSKPELSKEEDIFSLTSKYIDIVVDKEGNKNRYWYTYGTGTCYYSNSVPMKVMTVNKDTLNLDRDYISYWDNSQTKSIFYFKKGKLDGEQKLYYSDGKLKQTINYNNGIKNGLECQYDENNLIRTKINYENNIPKNMLMFFNDSMKKFYEGDVNPRLKYNGNGTLYYNNDSNSISYQGSFVNHKFHGDGVLYYQNGYRQYEGGFQNNRRQGLGTSYYESTGTIEYTGDWVADEKHGEGSLFTEAGEIVYNGNFHYDDMSFGSN
jgi:antitoxin component YwqK of YwqJK toxin-antitoxin module